MKKSSAFLSCFFLIVLLLLPAGCQKEEPESLAPCPVPMQSVEEKYDYANVYGATYRFSIPESWTFSIRGIGMIQAGFPNTDFLKDPNLCVAILKHSLSESEEGKKAYHALWSGNYQEYESYRNQPAASLQEEEQHTYSDFAYQMHQGTHGRILEVQYTVSTKENPGDLRKECDFYREDIPYELSILLRGSFLSESSTAEAGEYPFSAHSVALWIIDSLEVQDEYSLLL